MGNNPSGQSVVYSTHYNPGLLITIPRSENREKLGLNLKDLPFQGFDVWHAYELSWLNKQGKPQVAIGRLTFPCESTYLIESKSLKLYLNSLNQEKYGSDSELSELIADDLSTAVEASVTIELLSLNSEGNALESPQGVCLDKLEVEISAYHPKAELLKNEDSNLVAETLYTNLFRSNCPITNQPDWATFTVTYKGKRISHVALLQYLVSYREHNDYHESCVEKIFYDLQRCCEPDELTLQANFLRRGGLDINPLRTTLSHLNSHHFPRFPRQ